MRRKTTSGPKLSAGRTIHESACRANGINLLSAPIDINSLSRISMQYHQMSREMSRIFVFSNTSYEVLVRSSLDSAWCILPSMMTFRLQTFCSKTLLLWLEYYLLMRATLFYSNNPSLSCPVTDESMNPWNLEAESAIKKKVQKRGTIINRNRLIF